MTEDEFFEAVVALEIIWANSRFRMETHIDDELVDVQYLK